MNYIYNSVKKKALNTPVNAEILDKFRERAKTDNISMSKLVELFMIGYINGDFYVTFRKNDEGLIDKVVEMK